MRLIDFLRERKISNEQFAEMVGDGTTVRAVKKWKYGESSPRVKQLARIEEITGGEVRAADFAAAHNGEAA